jgi:hypothetical protein
MSTTTKILEDKIELINWITELKDIRTLDKLRFIMENSKPKEVIPNTDEASENVVSSKEFESDEKTQKSTLNTAKLTDADEEAFHEETKKRFPHLFKD